MAKHFTGVIVDKDFVLASELKKLGFRKVDTDDMYLRLQDWVHADIQELFDDNFVLAKKQVNAWKYKLRKLLSRPVGKYAHRKRPHRNLLPMMDSGDLHDHIKVTLKETPDSIWSYELNVSISSAHKAPKAGNRDHADLTNANITRAGTAKRNVAWWGWADEMMDGKGLKGVPSARNLMRSLFR